ncbi:MAG: bifunctional demethylmenaquinone methyltransferase/2-methoxy-6-polyprenyl-1,4-benzoquinol methylase UbiE [Coxiellaceae bacterium]|nr:bifunctional demethylmenaquinone methyltransferase/2-methoxy-6-polyprenyl-1,4-benzoquinol methylase UbiE [Coxiellaceae bacterium]
MKTEQNTENNQQAETTHFGYTDVPVADKAGKVAEVFHSVASKYDLMNDLMSFGLHRIWKRFAVGLLDIRKGQKILDLASGTGDIAALMSPMVGADGQVVLSDINESMLSVGRDRMLDKGLSNNMSFALANAESLPFEDNYFDRITIGFGLRNVTDKDAALRSMFRVLKPGGRCLILEFSKPPAEILNKVYDQYSFKLLPKIGKRVTGDEDSYRYLAESIRMHPDQNTLADMMRGAGFEDVDYHNLTGGIVACHRGFKY